LIQSSHLAALSMSFESSDQLSWMLSFEMSNKGMKG
jgi:hypothetical protein